MDKRKPGICYTFLGVVNPSKSCPCHQQSQTCFFTSCKPIMPSYLIISCEPIMLSCLVKLMTSKAHPRRFCKVWLGHQQWHSTSSKCKPTNRASGTISDNCMQLHNNRKCLQHKICSCNCEGISSKVQSLLVHFPVRYRNYGQPYCITYISVYSFIFFLEIIFFIPKHT